MLIVSDTVLSEDSAVKSCLSKRQSGIFRTLHLRPIIINADGRGCVCVCMCVCVCVCVCVCMHVHPDVFLPCGSLMRNWYFSALWCHCAFNCYSDKE